MKVTVIMEKASDGYSSCFVDDELPGLGLAGYGNSAEEAKKIPPEYTHGCGMQGGICSAPTDNGTLFN